MAKANSRQPISQEPRALFLKILRATGWRKRGNKVEGTILFVAQLAPKADNHPAMLMMTVQAALGGVRGSDLRIL